jgi:putative inorganic carbon (hco3(-)) transporter
MGERLAFGYGTSRQGGEAPSRGEAPAPPPPTGGARAAVLPAAPERREWAFIGLLAFTALLFFRPQDQFTALAPFHLAEMSAIIALIAMMIGRLSRGLPVSRLNPELFGVVALGGVMLITAPFSIWTGGAISTFTELYVKVILIFVLMVNTVLSPKRIEQFTWMIILASGYIAFRACFDYARGLNLVENGRVQGAVGGMFNNPNDLALNMVSVLPFALSFAFRKASTIRRLVAIGCALMMFMTIVASHSRSGSLGLAAVIIVMALLTLKRKPGLVAAGVLATALALPMLPASYWHRIASITDDNKDETASRQARTTLMRESYATFLEHPLTGVGAGQFQNYKPEGRTEAWRESHNAFLQVAAELGILGLVVFVFLTFRGFYGPMQARHLLKRSEPRAARGHPDPEPDVLTADDREMLMAHAAAASAAFAGWFVCAIFASVAYQWTLYYLLALALAPREYLMDRMKAARPARRSAVAPVVAEARA